MHRRGIALAAIALVLAACAPSAPTTAQTAPAILATPTLVPSATAPPTPSTAATSLPSLAPPTLAPSPTAPAPTPPGTETRPAEPTRTTALPATARPVGSPTVASGGGRVDRVKIVLIALGDGGTPAPGSIGCGDRAVPVERPIEPTAAPLEAAMRELLSLRQRTDGPAGPYNALYQSELRVERVALVDGRATISLTGQLRLGGVCDSPRVKAQLEGTARQFSTVREVAVVINGRPLDEALSLR
jgi:hypothetical protein